MAFWGFWHMTSRRPSPVLWLATFWPTDTSNQYRYPVAFWEKDRGMNGMRNLILHFELWWLFEHKLKFWKKYRMSWCHFFLHVVIKFTVMKIIWQLNMHFRDTEQMQANFPSDSNTVKPLYLELDVTSLRYTLRHFEIYEYSRCQWWNT